MLDYTQLKPFTDAKREMFMREAEDWRLARSLDDRSPGLRAIRRHAGTIMIQAGRRRG